MICPIISKPIMTHMTDDVPRINVEWVECQEHNCALWIGLFSKEGEKVIGAEYGCAFKKLAEKNSDGYVYV